MNEEEYNRFIALEPLMPESRSKLAIPFVGKDTPAPASEFAHPDIIIGLCGHFETYCSPFLPLIGL